MKKSIIGAITLCSILNVNAANIQSTPTLDHNLNVSFIDGNGDETPPGVHPDLITQRTLDTDRIKQKVESSLNALKDQSDLTLLDVGVPDYKLAYYELQHRIENSLLNFYERMDKLNMDLKYDLSRLYSLDQTRKKYNDSDWDEAYHREIMTLYPKMDKKLRAGYEEAIRGLYSLDNRLIVPVVVKKNFYKNILNEKTKKTLSSGHSGIGVCKTTICTKKIADDISNWIEFVHEMDKGLSMGERARVDHKVENEIPKVNSISFGVASFVKRMINMRLDENKVYTKGSATVDVLEKLGKSTIGVVSSVAYLPALIFDKVSKFTYNISNSNEFIITNLHADKLETYPIAEATHDYKLIQRSFSTKKENVSIGKKEISGILKLSYTFVSNSSLIKAFQVDKDLYNYFAKYYPEGLGINPNQTRDEFFESLVNLGVNISDETHLDKLSIFGFDKINKYILEQPLEEFLLKTIKDINNSKTSFWIQAVKGRDEEIYLEIYTNYKNRRYTEKVNRNDIVGFYKKLEKYPALKKYLPK